MSKFLNLPAKQNFALPRLKHESLIIPSTSQPALGSYFTIDLKEKNVLLHNLHLQFNVPAVVRTGTLSGVDCRFIPACFWMTRIEFSQNNNVIDTIYPVNNFIHTQLFNLDGTRRMMNDSQGNYSSTAQRVLLTNATSDYFVDLNCLLNQHHLTLLNGKDDIQLRIYMDTFSNILQNDAGSGRTPTSNNIINFCNIIAKVSRVGSTHSQALIQNVASRPQHHRFFRNTIWGF